jgi:hypothetical protein
MKTIRLDLAYPKRVTSLQNGSGPDAPQITVNIIVSAVNLCYSAQRQRHMSLSEARMWSKVQDAIMDEDGKPSTEPVELSDEQFEFLWRTLNEGQYPPEFASALVVVVDAMEKVKLAT